MKIIRSILSNLLTLLLSLVIAVLIWINAVQTSDPIRQEILPIPIQFVDQPPDTILADTDAQIAQVRFEGPVSILTDVTVSDFTAIADLSDVPLGTETTVPVEVQARKTGLTILFQSPDITQVLVETLESREIPVVLDIRGSVASGHTQEDPLINPSVIEVSGTATQVSALDSARVTVFLNNVRETTVDTLQPIFYDQQGRVASISGLDLSTNQVEVTIPVNESAGFAEKTITPNIIGSPATGYRLLSVTVEPVSVLVKGRQTQLDVLSRVQTEAIDITGLTEPTQFDATLSLPNGVSLDTPEPIVVNVDIAPVLITSIYNRQLTVQGLGEAYEAEVEPDEIRVVLYGPQPVLNELPDDEVQVTLDLFGLEPGVYSIAPVVNIPDRGIEIRSFDPALVSVSITPVMTPTEAVTETSSLPLPDIFGPRPLPSATTSQSQPPETPAAYTAVLPTTQREYHAI